MKTTTQIFYQTKIAILEDTIEQYKAQNQNLKETIKRMYNNINEVMIERQQYQLIKEQYNAIQTKLEAQKDKLAESERYYENMVIGLKEQLKQKARLIDILQIDYERKLLIKNENIRQLQQILQSKTEQIYNLQSQLHENNMNRLNEHQSFTIRYGEQNLSKISNKPLKEVKENIDSRAQEYRKKDKQQLKIMMKALRHAQRHYEGANQQVSMMLPQRNISKVISNKTFCA